MSDSSETKWEYQVEGAPLKLVGGHLFDVEVALRLKKLGEEGWEFVSFHDEQAFFKRRMASTDGAQSLFEEWYDQSYDPQAAKAGNAIGVIDGAIEKISSMRAELGAVENRLSHTVSNLMNVAENTASAKSRINDADYSIESANLAKAQVLQQAGTAMLSQANARSQLVLQLLQ